MNPIETVLEAAHHAELMYHRLIFVVGEQGAGKTNILQVVSHRLDKPLINVNLEVSKKLLEFSENTRKSEAQEILSDILDAIASDIVLLDNSELLFDTKLSLNPLRLFQNLSRNRTLIVAWNGRVENNHLLYAEPDHPEYRREALSSEIVVEIPKKQEIEI